MWMPKEQRAIVQGVNLATHHVNRPAWRDGGIQRRSGDPSVKPDAGRPNDQQPTKVGPVLEDGRKVRVARKDRRDRK